METEAAREVREEEDGWKDAGGHEEEAETCRVTVHTTVYARDWYA